MLAVLLAGPLATSAAWADTKPLEPLEPIEDPYVALEDDPLEGFNRAMFFINDSLDLIILSPVATVYNTILPGFVRDGITNVLANVSTPITVFNALLQNDPELAVVAVERFLINSTAGFGGFVDIAAAGNKTARFEDFGQTLAVSGVDSGPYIFLPILGPGTPRHLVGRIVDAALSPWTYIFWSAPLHEALTPAEATLVSARANADDTLTTLRETSPDLYASIRNLYLQNRENEINNGEVNLDELPDIPDIDH